MSTLTPARRKRLAKKAWKQWVTAMIVAGIVLLVFTLVVVGALFLATGRAKSTGQNVKDGQSDQGLSTTVMAADTLTQDVGCLTDPKANQCTSSEVTAAHSDLKTLAATPVSVTTPDGTTTKVTAADLPETLSSQKGSMPSAWKATSVDSQAQATLDGLTWTLTITGGQTLTSVTITEAINK